MQQGSSRWTEVTRSQFTHEAEGLSIVRELLPDAPPFRAWSNFEFRDNHGKWHEVDLLVLGRRRLHLVELKWYNGTLRGDDHRWLRDRHRAQDSPLKLTRRKAQRLATRLRGELASWAREQHQPIPDHRDVIPFVQEAVFLHHPGLRCALPSISRIDLFGLDDATERTTLPGIASRLLEPPTPYEVVKPPGDELLAELLGRIGLVQRRQREVGSWVIDEEPLAEGDGWQDWPAFHRVVSTDRARIRFYVTPPGAPTAEQVRLRRAAEREFRFLSRLAHEGLLRPRDMVDDELGTGLVYPYDERTQRLDLWLASQRDGVPAATQLAVLRRVAEAVGYAHRHRVVHRGLTPAGVHIRMRTDREPVVLVGDWQIAGSTGGGTPVTGLGRDGTTGLPGSSGSGSRLAALLRPGTDLDRQFAEVFQAPEGVWNRAADRVRLDVFSLGALGYYLIAGRPPAPDRTALRERLQRDGGLDLAADLPQVPRDLRRLVLAATRPAVPDRTADVATFLAQLAEAEKEVALPADLLATDPLEAAPGAVLDGRFRLERRLGAGSTAVGLLVTDLAASGEQRVLKVAVDDAAAQRLATEADVLRGLRHPRLVRLMEGPLEVGGRQVLVLEHAGDQTLAEVLRERPRLSLDLLARWGTEQHRVYRVRDAAPDTTGLATLPPSQGGRFVATAGPAGGGPIGQRLRESVSARSFLALGVDALRVDRAVDLLARRHQVTVVDVTRVLVEALRAQAAEAGVPWEVVRAADAAQPGTRDAQGLAALVQQALPAVSEAVAAAVAAAPDGARPVLLTELSPLARYGHLALLARWSDLAARRAQAIWVVVPQLRTNHGPLVDGRPLPLAAPGQFLRLDAEWLAGAPAGAVPDGSPA